MKKLFCFSILTVLLNATPSSAMPILSPDGTMLSGLDLFGISIDVSFSDGIVREVYESAFPAQSAFANAVSTALLSTLNTLGVAPNEINGCSDSCTLFNPDYYDSFNRLYGDTNVVFWNANLSTQWQVNDGAPGSSLLLPPNYDTSTSSITLVTFNLSNSGSVSSPMPLMLVLPWVVLLVLQGSNFCRNAIISAR